jgi:hypothetical protein
MPASGGSLAPSESRVRPSNSSNTRKAPPSWVRPESTTEGSDGWRSTARAAAKASKRAAASSNPAGEA